MKILILLKIRLKNYLRRRKKFLQMHQIAKKTLMSLTT
jgi:hypothetical protein